MLRRWLLVAHTLLHSKVGQLGYWAWRRIIQPRLEHRSAVQLGPRESVGPVSFTFLNRTLTTTDGALDWLPVGESRLWVYNLHYFNYLREPERRDMERRALIQDWICANPRGAGAGWEPYPTSLRLVNWCRWALLNPNQLTPAIQRSAVEQAIWLRRHLEKHILANHYFENLKALVFAGATLEHPLANSWLEYARSALAMQLREQFLADGGHYERSPSYHCLLIDGLLDLVELEQWRPASLTKPLSDVVRERAERGIGLLSGIEMPTDRYPLFNDSAFDSAPVPGEIYARARQLGLSWKHAARHRVIEYRDFGVYGLHNAVRDALAIKCGAVGPDYQPGHTHCDLLSFEWYVAGRPIVVDTGVYEYEPGAMRRYVRSTAAHNTVAVDDAEQSEIWGEFRVGRRARVVAADIEALPNGIRFDGEIKAFPQRGWVHHRRRINAWRDAAGAQLTVEDDLRGRGQSCLRSRVLLHPEIEVVHHADLEWTLYRDGLVVGALTVGEGLEVEIASAPYCPEFGLRLPAQQVTLRRTSSMPARLCYSLRIDHRLPSTISKNP